MTPQEELERGQLAADVLGNRVYVETMAQIKDEILARWQIEADEAKRDHLWRMIQCHKRLGDVMQQVMVTGKMQQKAIQAEQSRAERLKGMLQR